mmetsp:Transcript_19631/g.55423  ORF Transcript_19631/g.55423 Transcript_19631/m.55423 type:complete len:983 (+) Transcript_19631:370-3318(+)|eukprot:CAMPEP_0119549488 /NCGR_PEP_ID=MMETSP1352-20130426/3161_1 /TAXON_ID=265584 /ORGANISM="Stauroneis constricta, Strain CCMP1120" /LENGTH=982 /DNA_ID=CAMNT_0007595047 /DNA_START=355 /DNA_END=3303 /DNA_ORIENTATION=-
MVRAKKEDDERSMNTYHQFLHLAPPKSATQATRATTGGTATTTATSVTNSSGGNNTNSSSSNNSTSGTSISINRDEDGLLHDLVMPVDPDDPANLKMSADEKAERERKQRKQGAMAIGATVQNRVAAYLTATSKGFDSQVSVASRKTNDSSSGSKNNARTNDKAGIAASRLSQSFDADLDETVSAVAAQQHGVDGTDNDVASSTKDKKSSSGPGHRKSKSMSEVGAFFMPSCETRTKGMESSTTDDGGEEACAAPPPLPSRVHSAKTALDAACQDSVSTSTPNPIQLHRNRDFAIAVRPGAVHVPGRPSPHPATPHAGNDHSGLNISIGTPSHTRSGHNRRGTSTSLSSSRHTIDTPRHRRSRSANSHRSLGLSESVLAAGIASLSAPRTSNIAEEFCESSDEEEDANMLQDIEDDGSFSYEEGMEEEDEEDDDDEDELRDDNNNDNNGNADEDGSRLNNTGSNIGPDNEVDTSQEFDSRRERRLVAARAPSRNNHVAQYDHSSALVVAAELSPPDLNDSAVRAILSESEVEARVRRKILLEATEAQVVSVDQQHFVENSSTNSSQIRRNGKMPANATVNNKELTEEAKRIAEFKELHKHRTIREKVFGNARSQQAIDISATPECIRKRSSLKWTVRRNPATNLWVAAVHTNQKAIEQHDVAELERSVVNYSAVTQKEALEIGQAMAKPKMLRYSDNPICFVCRDKFALLRRPSHCRNCGVCICHACVVHWPAKMVPETFRKKRSTESGPGAGARFVKVCLACDWLATSFREALHDGNYDTAVDLYATGNINLRTPMANFKKGEVMHPIHAAVIGGNLRLVRWLTNTHCVPLRHAEKTGNQPTIKLKRTKDGPIRTSRGRSVLQLAMQHNKMEIICHLIGERRMTFSDEREFKDVNTLVTFSESLIQMLPKNFFEQEKQTRIEGTTLPVAPEGASPQDLVAPIHDDAHLSPPSPIMSQGSAFPSDVSSLGPSASQVERRGSF